MIYLFYDVYPGEERDISRFSGSDYIPFAAYIGNF